MTETRVFRYHRPAIQLVSLIAGYRGQIAVASIFCDMVARSFRYDILKADPDDLPAVAFNEHAAMEAEYYLIHVFDATSRKPKPLRAFEYGEPVEYQAIRKAVDLRLRQIVPDGIIALRDLATAMIAPIAEAGFVLTLADGLRRIGIVSLREYPEWNFDGAGITLWYLGSLIKALGWEIEYPSLDQWDRHFRQPVGEPGNLVLPAYQYSPN
jgi:hypothetical protein